MRRTLRLVALAAASIAWLDPWQHAREGNRLYAEGKFEDATTRYNEALVDHPDSPSLHLNLGDALYRQGKYDEAIGAFGQGAAGDADAARTARAAYNAGNAKYRLGEAAEKTEPEKALGLYAEAVAAYRRALGAASENADAKFNHEFVEKKIADLKQKLEEQRKQQEQKQEEKQNPQGEQKPPDEQQKEQQQGQPDQQGEQQKQADQPQASPAQQSAPQRPQPDQQAAPAQQPRPEPGAEPNQSPAAQAAAGEKKDGQMSRGEAAALLDAQRDQEVRPDEVTKRMQGAGIAEPAEDW